jgi:hypothetical protein
MIPSEFVLTRTVLIGVRKMRGISCLSGPLLASQEELCAVELNIII